MALAFASVATAGEPTDGGAQLRVEVADGGDTTLQVHRGQLRVRAGGEENRVGPNEAARVKRGDRLRRVSLLPAPTGLLPSDGAHINTTEVALKWKRVEGASSYHVTVASDEEFKNVVYETAHVEGPRLSAKLKEAGVYYWRISANAGDLEGPPSAARKLVIDTTPPKLKTGKPKWQ